MKRKWEEDNKKSKKEIGIFFFEFPCAIMVRREKALTSSFLLFCSREKRKATKRENKAITEANRRRPGHLGLSLNAVDLFILRNIMTRFVEKCSGKEEKMLYRPCFKR